MLKRPIGSTVFFPFLVLGCLWGLGCGTGGDPRQQEPELLLIQHCKLERHGDVDRRNEPVLTRNPMKESRGWHLIDQTVRADPGDLPVGSIGMGTGLLLTSPEGLAGIELNGPFEPRSFNSLNVELGSLERTYVGVHLMRDGKRVAAANRRVLSGDGDLALGRFDFPLIPDGDQAIDAVRILFAPGAWRAQLNEGVSQPVAVGRLEFRSIPKLWLLPTSGDSDSLGIGMDFRHGLALTDGLRLRIPMPSQEKRLGYGELHFSAGVPAEFCAPGDEPELVLVAADVEFFRAPLPLGRWQDFVLDAPDVDDIWITLEGGFPGDRVGYFAGPRLLPGLASPVPSQPRTVLLITSDTHRADHLACADQGVEIATPNLDALATEGTRFADCWSTTNVTTPSHVSILTGLSPKQSGVLDNTQGLTQQASTLAESFRDAGFETWALVSVPHLDPRVSGLGQGFDRYIAPVSRDQDLSETLPRLNALLDRPQVHDRFIWLHLFDAHAPYDPPVPYAVSAEGSMGAPLEPGAVPNWNEDAPSAEFLLAQYKGEISYLDAALGELLDRPDLKNASVVFTADHGESLGSHGIWWDHQGIYPDTLHVPLIFSGPGIVKGVTLRHAVQLDDLACTLSQWILGQSAGFPGSNMFQVDEQAAPRFAVSSGGHQACVELGGELLIMQLRAGRERKGLPFFAAHQVRLFDWRADPSCTQVLNEKRPGSTRSLRSRLLRWLGESQGLGLSQDADLDEEAIALLGRLGYGGDGASDGADLMVPAGDCDCEMCAGF